MLLFLQPHPVSYSEDTLMGSLWSGTYDVGFFTQGNLKNLTKQIGVISELHPGLPLFKELPIP